MKNDDRNRYLLRREMNLIDIIRVSPFLLEVIDILDARDFIALTSVNRFLRSLRHNRNDYWNLFYAHYHGKEKFTGLPDTIKVKIFAIAFAQVRPLFPIHENKSSDKTLDSNPIYPSLIRSSSLELFDDLSHTKSLPTVGVPCLIPPEREETKSKEIDVEEESSLENTNIEIDGSQNIIYLCPQCQSFNSLRCGHMPSYMTLIMNRCPPLCPGRFRSISKVLKRRETDSIVCQWLDPFTGIYCGNEPVIDSNLCKYHIHIPKADTSEFRCGPWKNCEKHSFQGCSDCRPLRTIDISKIDLSSETPLNLERDEKYQYNILANCLIRSKPGSKSECLGLRFSRTIMGFIQYPTPAQIKVLSKYYSLRLDDDLSEPVIIKEPSNQNDSTVSKCIGRIKHAGTDWIQCTNISNTEFCSTCTKMRQATKYFFVAMTSLFHYQDIYVCIENGAVIFNQDEKYFLIGLTTARNETASENIVIYEPTPEQIASYMSIGIQYKSDFIFN